MRPVCTSCSAFRPNTKWTRNTTAYPRPDPDHDRGPGTGEIRESPGEREIQGKGKTVECTVQVWLRPAVVVPVATDRAPLPDTMWTARREVVLGYGAAGNGNISSSMAKAGEAGKLKRNLVKAGQAYTNTPRPGLGKWP